jgi:hypothetical protein
VLVLVLLPYWLLSEPGCRERASACASRAVPAWLAESACLLLLLLELVLVLVLLSSVLLSEPGCRERARACASRTVTACERGREVGR